MTTSGVTSLVLNAGQIITFALRKLGVVSIGQDPDYNEVAPCLLELNMLLKNWETAGPNLWRNTLGSIPLVANTPSYSMTAGNPLRLVEVRYRYPDGHDLPLIRMSRIQYMRLPLKTSNGSPTQFYFDPQETLQTIYLWPVLKLVSTDQLVYTFQRRFQTCQTPSDTVDIVQEWLATVGYSLAEALLPNYGVGGERAIRIENSARALRRQAKAFDRPAFVQFRPEYRTR